jgi:hypothetical protein
MMDQFKLCYIPGGMSLYHSGWWLCKVLPLRDGMTYNAPIKMLKKAD